MVLCSVAIFMETFVSIPPATSTVIAATRYRVRNISAARHWGIGIVIHLCVRVGHTGYTVFVYTVCYYYL